MRNQCKKFFSLLQHFLNVFRHQVEYCAELANFIRTADRGSSAEFSLRPFLAELMEVSQRASKSHRQWSDQQRHKNQGNNQRNQQLYIGEFGTSQKCSFKHQYLRVTDADDGPR